MAGLAALIGILAGPIAAAASGSWTQQTASLAHTLFGISCPTQSTCFAVGSGGFMLRTTDAGTTWTPLASGVTDSFLSISCPNTTTCFTADNNGIVLKTTDGGQTWTSQSLGQYFALNAIDCPTTLVCYTARGFMTQDGGTTWAPQAAGADTISCQSASTCIAGRSSGEIVRSTSGGQSWTVQYTSAHSVGGVSCGSPTFCVALGGDAFGNTNASSTDGGITWTPCTCSGGNVLSVSCPDGSTCMAVAGSSQVLRTDNGASTWEWHETTTTSAYYAVACPTSLSCFVAGDSIAHYSGVLTINPTFTGGLTEGVFFNRPVATFWGGYGPYSATVAWGDGRTDVAGTSGNDPGPYTVTATHVYAEEGTYSVVVTVTDARGTSVSTTQSAQVADATVTVAVQALSATEGTAFSGVVATFSDADPGAMISDYTATVNWGDGSSSPGTIGPNGSGSFTVSASHVFAEEGSPNVTVTVTDSASFQASAAAIVVDAAIQASATGVLQAKKKTAFIAQLASFTDADPKGVVQDYSATIAWGDGTSSAGFVYSFNGQFAVAGSHTYAARGTYAIGVQVNDAGGAAAPPVSDTVNVS